ncbi:hypothetical protein J4G63_03105 [Aeromonas sobria]|uniref:hypothetical protein n=1 Tax=Aeromonas TaxID=642 RepID=UPI0012FED6A3|nr:MULTISPECIES: hypothetical protein [Aeromonas]MBS4686247.1 hypothetical protein [Aeromonas sobria]MCX7128353.1 hypothetical protein [Aeromonas sp.]
MLDQLVMGYASQMSDQKSPSLPSITSRPSFFTSWQATLSGGFWEVTSLDVGLVALHQAQRYAVPPETGRRGTLMTDDISHAVSSSFGSHHDRRRGFQGREAKTPARMRVDRRQQPQPSSHQVTTHDKGR